MHRFPHPRQIRAGGYTLIEFMIVIALIATATLAILGYKAVAKGDGDTAIETSNVAIIATKMPKLKAAGTYGAAKDNLLAPLIALGAIPSTMSVSKNTVTNAWGGAVNIVSTGPGYTISYAKLPVTACISMAMGMSGGSSDITTTINTGKALTGPVTAKDAAAGCTSPENTLLWTFAS